MRVLWTGLTATAVLALTVGAFFAALVFAETAFGSAEGQTKLNAFVLRHRLMFRLLRLTEPSDGEQW